MQFHNLSQDYFGVTTNLMAFVKSHILAKQFGADLVMHNDALMGLNFLSDISVKIEPDFFKGIPIEQFRQLKNKTSANFDSFICKKFESTFNKSCKLIREVPEKIDGDTVMFYEWFPKIHPVKTDSISLKINQTLPIPLELHSSITSFHVKNKSLLNVTSDIEITEYLVERYIKEFHPKELLFVGGCKEMVEYFSKKYNTYTFDRNYNRPLYHREKGDMNSVLLDIVMCAETNFVTNDFLHERYWRDIEEKYKQLPPELCFFNSIRYKKHIFDENLFMSNYFDLFVLLQKTYKFLI
jgi:hypothetical protein